MGAETGYTVVDDRGNRFHDSYRLLGVYDAESREPIWTQQRGERLRAALNRHLGGELVRFGPHERGQQLPAIAFRPNQGIDNVLTARDLERSLAG
jgi:hypothetical protein